MTMNNAGYTARHFNAYLTAQTRSRIHITFSLLIIILDSAKNYGMSLLEPVDLSGLKFSALRFYNLYMSKKIPVIIRFKG